MSFYNGILNHDEGSSLINIKGARGAGHRFQIGLK